MKFSFSGPRPWRPAPRRLAEQQLGSEVPLARNDSNSTDEVLAASSIARVVCTRRGELRLHAAHFVIGMDRETCEELATTLARAVIELSRRAPKRPVPRLRLVDAGVDGLESIDGGER